MADSESCRRVRALWDFNGEAERDLPFKKGDVIEVLVESADSDWWEGRDSSGKEGIFPRNYVALLDGEASTPSEGDTGAASDGSGGKGTADSASDDPIATERRKSTAPKRLSMRSNTVIKSVAVPTARRAVPEGATDGKARTLFSVLVETDAPQPQYIEKRYHEIRKLDTQLRSMFPDAMFVANPSAPALMRDKRSEATIELRRLTVASYLQGLVADPNMRHLLLTFLVPGERVELESPDRGGRHAPEAMDAATDAEAPARVSVLSVPLDKVPADGFVAGRTQEFSLSSLDGFDELLEKGYTLQEVRDEDPSAERVSEGQVVTIRYVARVWDGTQHAATEIEAVDSARFVVGDRGADVPAGLHAVVCGMRVGSTATAVIAPSLAYGEAGAPSLGVPAIAHLVYDITVLEAAGEGRHGDAGADGVEGSSSTSSGRASSQEITEAALREKYGPHLGTQPTRASFAPHTGRSGRILVGASTDSGSADRTNPALGLIPPGPPPRTSTASDEAVKSNRKSSKLFGLFSRGSSSRGEKAEKSDRKKPAPSDELAAFDAMIAGTGAVPPPAPPRVDAAATSAGKAEGDSRASSPKAWLPDVSPVEMQAAPSGTGPRTVELAALRDMVASGNTEGLERPSLEVHLSDADFTAAFSMPREEFSTLAKWKQVAQRKAAGLF